MAGIEKELKAEEKAGYYKLALALSTGMAITKAADEVGISYATAYRWMDRPKFKEIYHRVLYAMMSRTVAIMTASSTNAITVLNNTMNKTDDDELRCKVAMGILDRAINHHVALLEAKRAMGTAAVEARKATKETMTDEQLEARIAELEAKPGVDEGAKPPPESPQVDS